MAAVSKMNNMVQTKLLETVITSDKFKAPHMSWLQKCLQENLSLWLQIRA